jgi:ssDNA-binding Zn-finger/Zn-ribbon topoisomerase 1
VGLPKDLDVQVALAPVAGLWEQLNGWQQQRVEEAAAAELGRLADLLMLPQMAPRLLAGRLTDRMEETGGEALVNSPFGWITRKGLVRRPACSDVRCDDGIRLDTGGECDNCGNVIHIRRARRAKIAAQIDRELPGLGTSERRQVLEDRLREYATAEAEDFVVRRKRARAAQARRDAARTAAQEQAERERQAEAAAEAVRQAMPCEDCGQDRSAGLCEACGYRRRTEAAIVEAGMVAATWSAALDDAADVAAHVRATLEADIEATHQQFLELMEPGDLEANPVAAASVLAFNALQAVEQALPEYRSSALGRLGRTEEAEAEARRAYKTEQNRRWFRKNPNGADAVAAATKASDAARERTAEYLLATRLEQLRTQMADRTESAAPAPWSARLTELATRPLDGETAGAVIA